MEAIVSKEFPQKVIPLIDAAEKTIDIIVFDWRWYPQDPGASVQLFNQSLVRAVRRGVKIRAVANNDQIISILKSVGIDAKRLITQKILHVKLMIIDRKILIIGSHNYTQSAFSMNLELSAICELTNADNRFQEFFENIYNG